MSSADRRCTECNGEIVGSTCTSCGMSVVDASLDSMVQAASVPNLASLFRRAKDAGVLGPVSNYGEGKPKP